MAFFNMSTNISSKLDSESCADLIADPVTLKETVQVYIRWKTVANSTIPDLIDIIRKNIQHLCKIHQIDPSYYCYEVNEKTIQSAYPYILLTRIGDAYSYSVEFNECNKN